MTGPIFEFGFSDAILQMWAAFLAERDGALGDRLGCVTPAEALAEPRALGRRPALGAIGRRRAGRIAGGTFHAEGVQMRMRTTVILAALFGAAVWAAPAQARMVYVKNPGGVEPDIYVANDAGKDPRRIGIGRAPTISPDGRWVAFVTSSRRRLRRRRRSCCSGSTSGSQRLVMRASSFELAALLARLAQARRRRRPASACASTTSPADRVRTAARARSAATRSRPTPSGSSSGAASNEKFQSPSDLYSGPALGGGGSCG